MNAILLSLASLLILIAAATVVSAQSTLTQPTYVVPFDSTDPKIWCSSGYRVSSIDWQTSATSKIRSYNCVQNVTVLTTNQVTVAKSSGCLPNAAMSWFCGGVSCKVSLFKAPASSNFHCSA